MYEIECKICGVIFEAKRPFRQYCDKCQKNSKKAQAKLDRAVMLSKQHIEKDQPVEKHCSECGKFIKLVPHSMRNRIMYCSEECKKASESRALEARQRTKVISEQPKISVCPSCKKEFENPRGNIYCPDCKVIGRTKYKQYVGDITLKCRNCGKEFMIHSDKKISEYSLPKHCSPECRKAYTSKITSLRAEQKRKEAEELHKKYVNRQAKIDKIKQLKEYNENGLCGYCKTPYKQCERMQTQFRVIPEGAQFNMNGKIIKCPKFRSNK